MKQANKSKTAVRLQQRVLEAEEALRVARLGDDPVLLVRAIHQCNQARTNVANQAFDVVFQAAMKRKPKTRKPPKS